MKSLSRVMLVIIMVLSLSCSMIYADPESGDLDEIIDGVATVQTEQTEAAEDITTSNSSTKNNNFISGLNAAADLSETVDGVEQVTSPMVKAISAVVQFLTYVIICGMVVSAVLDLTYIAVTPLRGVLAGGQVPQQNQQFSPKPMMGGSMTGMMNSWGAQSNMMMNQQNQQQNMMQRGRINLISQAAINAVGNDGQIDQATGKRRGMIAEYAKSMAPMLIAIPILLVLAITGALTNIGFLIGELLVEGIGKLGAMTF